ncbi:MAG: phosphoglycerate kinase [Rhodopseudomonas palustris]|nr:phosphoglycerate kinase [Rhodopseudomonas palustris]
MSSPSHDARLPPTPRRPGLEELIRSEMAELCDARRILRRMSLDDIGTLRGRAPSSYAWTPTSTYERRPRESMNDGARPDRAHSCDPCWSEARPQSSAPTWATPGRPWTTGSRGKNSTATTALAARSGTPEQTSRGTSSGLPRIQRRALRGSSSHGGDIVPGAVNLLENLRFATGEKDNDEAFRAPWPSFPTDGS